MKCSKKSTHPWKPVILYIIVVVLAVSLSVTVLAATQYNWGPQDFTPYTGSFIARDDLVSAFDMKWTNTQVSNFELGQSSMSPLSWLTTEYEFRPVGYTPQQLWENGSERLFSNMPSAYYEFQAYDTDDIAVCSGYAAGYEANTYYYGHLYFDETTSIPSSSTRYIFESEYGMTVPGSDDSLPSAYEQYDLSNTYLNTYYSW